MFHVFMGALYVSIVQSHPGGNGTGDYLLQSAVSGLSGIPVAAGGILFLERARQDDGGAGGFGSCDAAQSSVELYVDLRKMGVSGAWDDRRGDCDGFGIVFRFIDLGVRISCIEKFAPPFQYAFQYI